MNKLEELERSFADTENDGVIGKRLAIKTISILKNIDNLIADFTEIQKDPELLARLADAAGGNQMQYSGHVAQILGKAKYDIEQL